MTEVDTVMVLKKKHGNGNGHHYAIGMLEERAPIDTPYIQYMTEEPLVFYMPERSFSTH